VRLGSYYGFVKKGKRVAVKGKFVFNTKEILELVEEAEAEASKGKSKKR
jgi:hypothetical protein